MAKNPITVLAEGNKLIDELEAKLTGVNSSLLEISKAARGADLKQYFDVKSPNDVNEKLKLQKTIIEQLNAQVKERDRLEKALNNQLAKNKLAESDLNKELVKSRYEVQKLNQKAKESAILSSDLSTKYEELVVRMNQAGRAKQNLVAKQAQGIKLSNKEQAKLKQSSKEFAMYEKAVRKADASIKRYQRNVGNYSSALGKAGLAVRNFAGAFGVLSAIEIGRQIFELTKEIDGLDKALLQVTETQEIFNQAQGFIRGLAEESGVEINGLQRAYTKFFAAAKTTNLTLAETQNIFRQTAKAGAVLGLSTDDINGSMRALEQILSKGKVQAEEIRGQLGERLPGAFQILAKSMGLTTAELSKQLELGNVLSEEVLPGFADELAKTYSLYAVNKVDTLTAAQNRLSNSWTDLVRSFSEDGGVLTDVFKDVITFLSNAIKGFAILNMSSEKLNQNLSDNIQSEYFKEVSEAYKELGDAANDLAEEEFIRSEKAVLGIQDEIRALKSRNKELSNSNLRGRAGASNVKELTENREKIESLTRSLGKYKGILEASEKQLGINTEGLGKNTEETDKNNDAKTKTIKVLSGSMAFLRNEIKLLEEKRDKLARNSREYEAYTVKIEEAEKALSDFRIELEGVSKIDSLGDMEDSLKRITDILTKPKVIEGLDNSGLDDIQEQIDRTREAEKKKQELAQETADFKKQLEEDLAYSIVDLTNTLFDAKVQKYDDEIQKNNDKYAAILDNEKLTEKQRDALEAERDRKNAQLEKKKREEQRKQAIFNKAISLFEIGINTAEAITKASPVVPLMVLAGAVGAVQAATVLATPVPAYKDGKKKGEGKDGIALLNDGGKDELKISEGGNIERITGRNVLAPVLKSDTIIPDADKFLSNLSDQELYNNLHKHSILASVSHQKQTLDTYLMAQSIEKAYEKQTNRVIKAMEKNRPNIKLFNNNSIGDDLAFLSKLNEL